MSDNGRVVLTPRDDDVPPRWYSNGGSSGSRSHQHWSDDWDTSRSQASGESYHDRQRRIAPQEDGWNRQDTWHSKDREHRSSRVIMEPRRARKRGSQSPRRGSRQDVRYPHGIGDDPVERIVSSEDEPKGIGTYRSRSRSYRSDSAHSRSRARGILPDADGRGRSVSPVSVGSSVLGEATSDGVRARDRPSNRRQPATTPSNSNMRIEGHAVASQTPTAAVKELPTQKAQPPSTERRKVRKVRQSRAPVRDLEHPVREAAAAGSSRQASEVAAAGSSRPHKRRRVAKSSQGQGPTAEPLRRTAAKSAALRPQPPDAAPAADELTESEKLELQVAVLNHLRDLVHGEEEDAEVLVEFICVLVEGKKSREEMIAELNTLDDEAGNFVDWLQKTKAAILAKRKPPPAPPPARRPATPPATSPAMTPAVAPTLPKAPMMAPQLEPPPGLLTAPGPAAVLTPNAVTASLEETPFKPKVAAVGPFDDQSLVVITQRLVLQPNRDLGPQGLPGDDADFVIGEGQRVLTESEKKLEEANQKKMQLLAEMTQKLQVILKKLSDKNLDDATKERYQSLAQTIQTQMATLSRPPPADKKLASIPDFSMAGWEKEKESTSPVAAGKTRNGDVAQVLD